MAQLHGQSLENVHRKRHTNIFQGPTRLQTNFIRMLRFRGPLDLIFRVLPYFALINCGQGDTQTEVELEASLDYNHHQTPQAHTFVHKHKRLAVF